jgi:Icc-related predicted phosphoesterase
VWRGFGLRASATRITSSNVSSALPRGSRGDAGMCCSSRETSPADRTTAPRSAPRTIPIPGNHDASNIDAPENIDGRLIQVEGIRLFGIGGGGPTVFGFPYEWTDEEMEGVQIPDCDLLLSHSPPASTPCDLTRRGAHAGSRVIRRELERAARAMVCGHIHEAVGFAFVGGKLCYNAGTLGEPFGRLQVGILTFERGGRTSIEHHVLDSLPPQGTRGG